jgi:Skp family chaperone for outer membrane proteins
MYGKNKPYQNPEPLPVVKDIVPEIAAPTVSVTSILIYTVVLALFIFLYLNRSTVYMYLEKAYKDFQPGKQVDELESQYQKLFQQFNDASMNQKKIDDVLEHGNQRMDSLETREKRLIELLEKNQSCDSLEKKEQASKEMEKKEQEGGLKKLNEKISGYTKEQTVTSNGYCYIGYDNNHRECTNVSEGDICMSGQVFPTLDICLYPKFRT